MVGPVEAALYPGLLALGCAALMDAWVRVPSEWHPVAWFGKLAQWLIDRAPTTPEGSAFRVGLAIAIGLPLSVACAAWFLLRGLFPWYGGVLALQPYRNTNYQLWFRCGRAAPPAGMTALGTIDSASATTVSDGDLPDDCR